MSVKDNHHPFWKRAVSIAKWTLKPFQGDGNRVKSSRAS